MGSLGWQLFFSISIVVVFFIPIPVLRLQGFPLLQMATQEGISISEMYTGNVPGFLYKENDTENYQICDNNDTKKNLADLQ